MDAEFRYCLGVKISIKKVYRQHQGGKKAYKFDPQFGRLNDIQT